MMQIQRHFRFSLLLCLVPTVQLFGQAPTLTVSTPLNPGSPIQVTGTKGSSVAISSPSKDGVSCGDAGLFDLGNPLLIHEGADSPAQTLPLTGSPQSIVPSAPTSPNQTLCFRATNVAGVTYSSQKVAAPMVKIQFAVQPVGGLNAISIQGDANARVGVLELPASYKPNPKSDSCSANDLSNGQWLAIGLGDSTTGSTPLNGTPPFTIALSKPLEAGVQLCLVALETIAGGTTPYYSPFATVLGAAPVAQSQPAATGTPCAFKADPTQPTPKFEPVDVDPTSNSASGVANNSIAGTVAGAKSGTVQVCLVDESAAGTTSYTALGAPVPVGNGSFSLKLTDIKPPPALKTGQKFVAQFESAATGNATVYGPLSASVIAGDCASDGINPGLIAPILDQTKPPDKGVMAIAGKFASSATPGNVRVCVDGLQQGTPVTVAQFATPGITVPALSPGSVVVAQLISSSVSGALKFGPFSPEVAVGTCTGTGSGDSASKPTLTSVPSLGGQIVTGSVPLDKSGHPIARLVRVCVDKRSIATTALASPNDRQITVAHVNANGNFTATLPDGLNHGERVFVQAITSNPTLAGSPRSYGLPSDFAKPSGFRYSNFFGTYIGGVEESGFSSDNINTNAFISAFIRSNYLGNLGWHHQVGFAPWGRIRLLSAPRAVSSKHRSDHRKSNGTTNANYS